MASPTVGEVLEVLRKSFQGIDLRAVIVALGDQQGWRNAFTVIRFSARPPEEISAEHEELKKLYELPSELLNKRLGMEHNIEPYKGINIELSAYPITQFDHIAGRIDQGIIRARNRAFRVFDPDLGIDLKREEMYRGDVQYEEIGYRWPVYYWGRVDQRADFRGSPDGGSKEPRLDGRELDREARTIGLSNFQELAERITGQPFLRASGHAFEIFAPIFAHITSIATLSDAVKVSGSFHPVLGELMVECSLQQPAQLGQAMVRILGRARISPQSVGQELVHFSREFALENTPKTGLVRASLFKQIATRVDLHEQQSPLGTIQHLDDTSELNQGDKHPAKQPTGKELGHAILKYLLKREHASNPLLPDVKEITEELGARREDVDDQIDILDSQGAIKANRTFGGAAPMLTGVGKATLEELEEEKSSYLGSKYMSKVEGTEGVEAFEWDVFISHATEDKESFVRELAIRLSQNGIRVWYDEFTLTVGDSLRESIDKGLGKSRYGVVVLSPSFFLKDWPQKELNALLVRDSRHQKVVLPVWLNVDFTDVSRYSPLLADRIASKAVDGMDKVVTDLLRVVQPT